MTEGILDPTRKKIIDDQLIKLEKKYMKSTGRHPRGSWRSFGVKHYTDEFVLWMIDHILYQK